MSVDSQGNTITTIGTTILLSLERFADAWQSLQHPPNLRDFLGIRSSRQWHTLVELIKVDLEYRYQVFNYPKRLDDYVDEYSELRSRPLPIDLIYEEFYFRSQSGLRVDPLDYLEKYPDYANTLQHMLGIAAKDHTTFLASRGQLPVHECLKPGQCFDDFELITELGQGSFAKVFKARQCSMNRLVAVKISQDVGYEPQTLAQMDHPNIVRVFDQRTLPKYGLRLLYMEYVPGGTLQNVVDNVSNTPPKDRNGKLLQDCVTQILDSRNEVVPLFPILANSWPSTVCCIGAMLAKALDCAHQQGILHLDIKPANILLAADGCPKLADFNISISTNFDSIGANDYIGGSMAYMSPEQLEACHPDLTQNSISLDARSDVYSLGITLWQLLFGQRPFPNQSTEQGLLRAMEAMIKIRKQDITTLKSALAAAPDLVCILHTCIKPNPNDRWPSATILARELSLCNIPKAYALIHPSSNSVVKKMRSLTLPILILAALIPNALAGLFNYYYNTTEIIAKLPELTQSTFWDIQTVINLIAFPLGLGWFYVLALPVIKIARKNLTWNADLKLESVRSRCLNLGHLGALINIGLWSSAGIAYPLAIHFSAGAMTMPDYPHFFGSLFLCGVIASVYPFFLITAFCVRVVYPKFILTINYPEKEQAVIAITQKRTFFYLSLATLVPLLTILILVLIDSKARLALVLLSAASFMGLGVIFLFFRCIHHDLSALREVLAPPRQRA